MNYTFKRRLSVRAFKVWHIVTDYTKDSSIHGIRYLTEHNRPIIEKICWIIVFIAAIVTCVSLIFLKIVYRNSFPIMFGVSEKPTSIWEIPFPAITICPPFRYDPNLFNFTADPIDLYDLGKGVQNKRSIIDSKEDFEWISKLETFFHFIPPNFAIHYNDTSNLTSGYQQFRNLYQVTPSGNQLLKSCNFQSDADIICEKYITEIITDAGICLTFNLLNLTEIFKKNGQPYMDYAQLNLMKYRDLKSPNLNESRRSSKGWQVNRGYDAEPSKVSYPLRIRADTHEDFKIEINIPNNFKAFDFGNYQTFNTDTKNLYEERFFKMILHSPADFPQVRMKFLTLKFNHNYNIIVKPIVVNTTEELLHYTTEERQCYFSHEGNLTFFQIYTQDNCELECLAKFTLHECQCVTLSMPRNNDTTICSYKKIPCYRKAKTDFEQSILFGNKQNVSLKCKCMKACTDIQYEANMIDKTSLNKNINTSDRISLTVSFTRNDLIIYQRKERQSLIDFLSFSGGILSLFMGISLLSFIEIIYYFSIRFICNIGMRYQRQRRINRKNIQSKQRHVVEAVVIPIY